MISGCNGTNSSSIKESSSSLGKIHQINVLATDFCEVTLNKYEAFMNEEIIVTISNLEKGYQINRVEANGNKIDDYRFYMPNEDVNIEIFADKYETSYSVNITPSPYALITTNNDKYLKGDKVEITYYTRGTYILYAFYVNGEKIDGTSFVMPDKDVTIHGEFIDAIEDTDYQLLTYGGGLLAKSHWYFRYLEEGIEIKVKVIDRAVKGSETRSDPGYRDNIEFILSYENDKTGWDLTSHKVLISCDGDYYLQKATNSFNWSSSMKVPQEDFNFDTSIKSAADKQGYDGYDVRVFVSYNLLGYEYEDALNHLTICMAQRNTTNYNATDWATYSENGCVWENASTHPIILQNGKLQAR